MATTDDDNDRLEAQAQDGSRSFLAALVSDRLFASHGDAHLAAGAGAADAPHSERRASPVRGGLHSPTQRLQVLDTDLEPVDKDFLRLSSTSKDLRFLEVAFGIQWRVTPFSKLPLYAEITSAILAAQGKRTRLHKRVDSSGKALTCDQVLHLSLIHI